MGKIASEFVEFFFVSPPVGRVASAFTEVWAEDWSVPTTSATQTGVWPQESLSISPNVQGSRLRRHRGQM